MSVPYNVEYTRFVNYAKKIPNFEVGQKEDVPYDITHLMTEYCSALDSKDTEKQSQYISALMIRYWHVIVMLFKQSQSTRLEFEDIVDWVYQAFEKAAHYRSWLDSSKGVSKDPRGAEKVINQCITSIRQYWYYNFNHDARKVNYLTISLCQPLNSGEEISLIDTISDTDDTETDLYNVDLITSFINKDKLLEAILLDIILCQETFVMNKSVVGLDEEGNKIVNYSSKFSKTKLFAFIRTIGEEYINYFSDKYSIDKDRVVDAVSRFKVTLRQSLSNQVKKLFESIQSEKIVKDFVC